MVKRTAGISRRREQGSHGTVWRTSAGGAGAVVDASTMRDSDLVAALMVAANSWLHRSVPGWRTEDPDKACRQTDGLIATRSMQSRCRNSRRRGEAVKKTFAHARSLRDKELRGKMEVQGEHRDR